MINSVGDYVAGEEYDLDRETAEHFLIAGYAAADEHYVFTDEQMKKIHDTIQKVEL